MKKKSYKQRYEELKAQVKVDNKIHTHTRSYIHIPFSWSGFGRVMALLGSGVLAVLNFMLIISIGNIFKVWELLGAVNPEETYHSFTSLIILYPIVGEYLLVGLTAICMVAVIKGGFGKLKPYNKSDGLIVELIAGLIFGLILCLIAGLIAGLILWLIAGLIFELIAGLIVGLILCLIFGLIVGLIAGLIAEFEEGEGK
jgi:hypothetical protein